MAFRILDASAFYAGVPFGSTMDSSLYTGAMGVMINTSRLSCSMGPPRESECPVDPLGVAIMMPSIFCFTLSF